MEYKLVYHLDEGSHMKVGFGIFETEDLPKTTSLSLRASNKVCVHFTFSRLHLWDCTRYIYVVVFMLLIIGNINYMEKFHLNKTTDM